MTWAEVIERKFSDLDVAPQQLTRLKQEDYKFGTGLSEFKINLSKLVGSKYKGGSRNSVAECSLGCTKSCIQSPRRGGILLILFGVHSIHKVACAGSQGLL